MSHFYTGSSDYTNGGNGQKIFCMAYGTSAAICASFHKNWQWRPRWSVVTAKNTARPEQRESEGEGEEEREWRWRWEWGTGGFNSFVGWPQLFPPQLQLLSLQRQSEAKSCWASDEGKERKVTERSQGFAGSVGPCRIQDLSSRCCLYVLLLAFDWQLALASTVCYGVPPHLESN